ncbi:MAG: alpha/beta hydrolase [Pseudomonadota bacterium]
MITDWDDAYANGDHIDGAADYPPRWAAMAAAFRDECEERASLDLAYGPGARNRFDLFRPKGAARGLVVFVHGGYWRAFDKSSWSWLARGALAHGWAVAAPSYTLAPEARIADITREVGAALEAAAAMIEGPIRLSGHSAGGHLVTRMMCADTPVSPDLAARIERVVSISGVHDLRPLLRLRLNGDLRLDAAEADAESPALLSPRSDARLICHAGAEERPEFRRQSALLANIWRGLGVDTVAEETAGRHHFDVIDGLADPDHPLTGTLCD